MPDEIIDMWLVPQYRRFGWPPTLTNDWRYVLLPGNDLRFLQNIVWKQEPVSLSPQRLEPTSQQMISDMFRTYVLNRITAYTAIVDGPQRFRSCCEYIKANKVFPRPVALLETINGFRVLDGHHRLTALFYLYGCFEIDNDETSDPTISDTQTAWVGTLRAAFGGA
jgi:hypothetical protein